MTWAKRKPRLFWFRAGRSINSWTPELILNFMMRPDLMARNEAGRMVLTAFSFTAGIRPYYHMQTATGWVTYWKPWVWIRNDSREIALRLAGGPE